MTDSEACDVALFTFSPKSASCNGCTSAQRRLQYERKLELPINRKITRYDPNISDHHIYQPLCCGHLPWPDTNVSHPSILYFNSSSVDICFSPT